MKRKEILTTSAATQLGRRGIGNVCILGVAVKYTGLIHEDVLKKTLEEQSPKGFKDVNLKALEAGLGMTEN